MSKIYKKLHKWQGLIISVLLLYYSLSGIMNHSEFFSGIDVARSVLPENFQYHNWNNGAMNMYISWEGLISIAALPIREVLDSGQK